MSCYCMQMFAQKGFNPLNLKNIKWDDVGGEKETGTFCNDWVSDYSM